MDCHNILLNLLSTFSPKLEWDIVLILLHARTPHIKYYIINLSYYYTLSQSKKKNCLILALAINEFNLKQYYLLFQFHPDYLQETVLPLQKNCLLSMINYLRI